MVCDQPRFLFCWSFLFCVLVCFISFFCVWTLFPPSPSTSELYFHVSIFCTVAESVCICRTISLLPCPPPHTEKCGGGGRVLYLLDSLLRSGSLYIVVLYMLWICLGVCLRVPYLLSGEEGKDGKFGCSLVSVI